MDYDFYCLVMFPYPSGSGLHVGHHYNYSVIDSYCRWLRFQGKRVFQPFGYDAFGLPAENYARSVGREPREVTMENIANFRKQMARMNTQYDELLVTCDSSYQKWTQWIFAKMLEKGLAYKADGDVNWCQGCSTVLANEQVKDGKCERCGCKIETKRLNQWYFRITAYKDRLIRNLDSLDYPQSTIDQQRHWLENLRDWCISRQRKWGCPIPVGGETETLDTFVDSSFYFLRYLDPTNDEQLFDADKYRQVDLYVGGNEHACMHLIYARFVNMFLYDLGLAKNEEPFRKLFHQGMIRFNGEKMSKSRGNTISPDDYDPDVLRMYLMFIGPYWAGGDWSDQNIMGVSRFLDRFRAWMKQAQEGGVELNYDEFQRVIFSNTQAFKFNKVVSEFMTLIKTHKNDKISIGVRDKLVDLLNIYAPGFKV